MIKTSALIRLLLLVFLPASLVAQNPAEHSEGPFEQLIIRGATLINGNGAPPTGPVDIVIEGNRISAIKVVGYPGVEIDREKRPKLAKGGKELDADGMYVLPGFIDMHGHIGGEAQGADSEYVFRLWMAHGITTVREPSGRGIDYTLNLKKLSRQNKITAPRIVSYTGFGQVSESFNPLNDQPINTPEKAREWVRANAQRGADGIKFFGGRTRDHVGRAGREPEAGAGLCLSSCTDERGTLERTTFGPCRPDEHGALVWASRSTFRGQDGAELSVGL